MCMNEGTGQRWVTIACAMAFLAGTVGTLKEAAAQEDAKRDRVVELEKRVQDLRAAERELRDAKKELEKEVELRGDFNRRLDDAEGKAWGQHGGNVTVSMTDNQNGTEYSVQVQNGATTVKKDGRALSKDEYRTVDGRVEFLDKDGNVEHTMQLPQAGGQWGGGNMFRFAPRAQGNLRGLTLQGDNIARAEAPPPVMLGITMSDHKDGAMIDSVREGLPAEKGGLRAGDIIVHIDKKPIEGQADVRSVLRKYKDGDVVSLDIIRDGDAKVVEVTLEAWDAEKLGQGGMVVPGVPAMPGVPDVPDPFNGDMSGWWKNFAQGLGGDSKEALTSAREALEAALEQVDAAKDNLEELRKAAKDGLEAAIASLKEAEENAEARHGVRLIAPNQEGGAQTLVLPRVYERTRERDDEVSKQLEEMREQLKELRKQMEEANKKKDGE